MALGLAARTEENRRASEPGRTPAGMEFLAGGRACNIRPGRVRNVDFIKLFFPVLLVSYSNASSERDCGLFLKWILSIRVQNTR